MRRLLILLGFLAPLLLEAARVKDISRVSGQRDNQLVGYGLVVGLAGDGDSNALATLNSVANVLERSGLKIVRWSFDPPQVLVEVPDEAPPANRVAETNGHDHSNAAPEEIKA